MRTQKYLLKIWIGVDLQNLNNSNIIYFRIFFEITHCIEMFCCHFINQLFNVSPWNAWQIWSSFHLYLPPIDCSFLFSLSYLSINLFKRCTFKHLKVLCMLLCTNKEVLHIINICTLHTKTKIVGIREHEYHSQDKI